MLVIERAVDEQVVIVVPPSRRAELVLVTVTGSRGRAVVRTRLGFEAERDVKIYRAETFDAAAPRHDDAPGLRDSSMRR